MSPATDRRLTAALTFVIVLDVVVVGVGRWNPWHYVAVDRWLFRPWLGGLLALLVIALWWFLNVRRDPWRLAGLALVGSTLVVWMPIGVGWRMLRNDNGLVTDAVANQRNDVQAHVTMALGWVRSPVILGAERGRASRSQVVEHVGYVRGGDSGPPPLDLEFTAADELTVTYKDRVVYRLTFDPRTLDVLGEECRPIDDPPYHLIGCEG